MAPNPLAANSGHEGTTDGGSTKEVVEMIAKQVKRLVHSDVFVGTVLLAAMILLLLALVGPLGGM